MKSQGESLISNSLQGGDKVLAAILKPLFEILTGKVAVMDNVIYNWLIMFVIGEVAYRVAKSFVRNQYSMGAISGKASGSIIHWTIRLLSYVICAYMLRGCIWLYEFTEASPHWVLWLLLGIAAIFVLAVIAIVAFGKREVKVPDETGNKESN